MDWFDFLREGKRRFTCIDFGGSFVKAACVERRKTGCRLLTYIIKEFDTSSAKAEDIGVFLTRLLGELGGFPKDTYISISGPEGFFVKKLTLPYMPREKLIRAARQQLKEEIHFDCDECFSDLQVIRESGESGAARQAEFYCLFVKKDLLDKYLFAAGSCGLVPKKASTSVFNYCGILGGLPAGRQTSAILDVGNTHSYISIYQADKLSFVKSLDFSASRLCASLCGVLEAENGDIEIDFEKAEKIVRSEGVPFEEDIKLDSGISTGQITGLMQPLLDSACREIENSFSHFSSSPGCASPGVLYITGGGANIRNLGNYISRKINIKTEKLPLPPSLDIRGVDAGKFFSESGQLSSAIGLAMPSCRMNLISAELKSRMMESVRVTLLRLVFILIGVALVFFWVEENAKELESGRRAGHASGARESSASEFGISGGKDALQPQAYLSAE
jgi:Tfp pilus assembly PilM family ATPase